MKQKLLIVLALMIVSIPAVARYKPMTLPELKANSNVIAVVEVTQTKQVGKTVHHREYSQQCTLRPIEVLKGRLNEGDSVLRGANFACDPGTFASGERYLLFLKRSADGVYVSTNHYNGIFPVQGEELEFHASKTSPRRVKSKLSDVIKRLR